MGDALAGVGGALDGLLGGSADADDLAALDAWLETLDDADAELVATQLAALDDGADPATVAASLEDRLDDEQLAELAGQRGSGPLDDLLAIEPTGILGGLVDEVTGLLLDDAPDVPAPEPDDPGAPPSDDGDQTDDGDPADDRDPADPADDRDPAGEAPADDARGGEPAPGDASPGDRGTERDGDAAITGADGQPLRVGTASERSATPPGITGGVGGLSDDELSAMLDDADIDPDGLQPLTAPEAGPAEPPVTGSADATPAPPSVTPSEDVTPEPTRDDPLAASTAGTDGALDPRTTAIGAAAAALALAVGLLGWQWRATRRPAG